MATSGAELLSSLLRGLKRPDTSAGVSLGAAGAGVAAGDVGAGVANPLGGIASPGKRGFSLSNKLKGGLGIAGLLALILKGAVQEDRGLGIEADLQGQLLDAQSEAATPENFLIQALLPSSEQQKQQALQALMQQLTGGNAPRALARGEVLT